MGLKEDIQRSMIMDAKGHKTMVLETRDIKADRALCVRLSKAKSTNKAPEVVTSLYAILGGRDA